jgi:hypothetical protein
MSKSTYLFVTRKHITEFIQTRNLKRIRQLQNDMLVLPNEADLNNVCQTIVEVHV